MSDVWTDLARPVPNSGIEAIDVDGELVLWHPGTNQIHRLDAIASTLWPLLDGSVTLAELVDDIADAWSLSRDRARLDLVQLLDALRQRHLVDLSDGLAT